MEGFFSLQFLTKSLRQFCKFESSWNHPLKRGTWQRPSKIIISKHSYNEKNNNSNNSHTRHKNKKWEGALHPQDLICLLIEIYRTTSGIYDILFSKIDVNIKKKDVKYPRITNGFWKSPKKAKNLIKSLWIIVCTKSTKRLKPYS